MAKACGACGAGVHRVEMRVLVFGRVWVERVDGVECPACGAVAMTKAGSSKVDRVSGVSREVLGLKGRPGEPVLEVTRVLTG